MSSEPIFPEVHLPQGTRAVPEEGPTWFLRSPTGGEVWLTENYEGEFFLTDEGEGKPGVDPKKELERLTKQKDEAYGERNKIVAFLSKLFPSSLERHPAHEEWDDDWRWIVFIDIPTGQLTWHIHDSEVPMFDHLSRQQGRLWDGHTTEEKYARMEKLKPRY